jgi:hypothetical protein
MKKNFLVTMGLVAAVTAASATAFAYTDAKTGITGSRHDINAFATQGGVGNVTKDSQERVCAFCHTPHHAYTTDMAGAENADYLPLWSHELTAKTYTGYASDTLQAVIGDPLIGPSRLCMSCHDGVIAVDTHYLNLGTAAPKSAQLTGDDFYGPGLVSDPAASGAVGKGTSLAGDHPIGFDYIAAQSADAAAGGGLAAGIKPATSFFIADGVATTIAIKDTLYGVGGGTKTIMTCATCHEVHNKDNVVQKKFGGADMGVNYFLYGSQTGSQICLSCHNK